MGSETVVRPAGLGYAPAGVEKYDPRTDIPSDALDAKDFSSIKAWLDACVSQNKAGKIGSGTYHVDGAPHYAPKGIYGYGDTPPKFVADKVGCWLYLKDGDVALKGLEFEGFGQVLGGAVPLTTGNPYHTTTTYGFSRFQVGGNGSTGLALQAPASKDTVGPDVDISDCKFVNCENAFTFVSDTVQAGKVDFNNNVLTGTYGILDINSLYWTEVNASGNEWADATGSRVQPNVKQNGVQTGFKIGTDYYVPLAGHATKLAIVNNYAHDIQSIGTSDNVNAATFVDARGVDSAQHGDNIVSFNRIERLQGLKGQDDANVIYAKAWGLIVQGNYIEDSGAAYLDTKRNGSEATGVLVKPGKDGIAKDIEIVGNTFVNMPTAVQGVVGELSVVKLSEAIGDSSISFNKFIGGGNVSGSLASGVVRWYGDYENAKVVGNSFTDVTTGPNDNAIVFHQLTTHGVGAIETSNNSATKTAGDYAADTRLIYFDGAKSKSLVTGYNTLDGNHAMLLSRAGTAAATAQTYDPPKVTLKGVIEGSAGQDELRGTPGEDVLNAFGSSDILLAGAGNDRMVAGAGNDSVDGGAGSDTLVLIGSRSQYTLSATANGFTVADSVPNRDGTDMVTNVEFVEFAGGDRIGVGNLTNRAPTVAAEIDDQTARQGEAFSFAVPASAFSDPDASDTLTYRATLDGGAALPRWLAFDPATRAFSGTPANADVGALQVKITVTDSHGASASDVFALKVGDVNDAPQTGNGPESQAGTEDTALNGRLAAGSDPEGDPLTYELVEGSATHGIAAVDADGRYAFTPDKDFAGTATFDYRVSDGTLASAPKTVTLTFAAVNDLPTAADASLNTAEDVPLKGSLPASDADGDALAYVIVSGPAHGVLTLGSKGDFTYTPAADYAGPDGFTYKASDGSADSGTAAVAITVDPVADAPRITSDGGGDRASVSIPENTVAVTLLTTTDGDSGDTQTYGIVGGTDRDLFQIDARTGALTFRAAPDFEAPADAGADNVYDVVVGVSDKGGLTDTQTLAVKVGNVAENVPAPAGATASGGSVDEDGRVTLAIAMEAQSRADLGTTITVGNIPAGWTVAENGGRYDPASGRWTIEVAPRTAFSGGPALSPPADSDADIPLLSVSFTNVDRGGSRSEPVTIGVAVETDAVADAPLLTLANAGGAEDSTVAMTIGAAPADTDGSEAITAIFIRGVPAGFSLSAGTDKGGGEWQLAAADLDKLRISAPADFTGTVRLAVEAVVEETTLSGAERTLANNVARRSGEIEIAWRSDNDAPTGAATAALAHGTEDQTYVVKEADLLTGFSDGDGDVLRVANLATDKGNVTANGNGTYTIGLPANFNGPVSLGYAVTDGNGGSKAATQSFVVDAVNDAPVAAGGVFTARGNAVLNGSVTASDVDSQNLVYALVGGPSHGSLTLGPNGAFAYTPAAGYSGPDGFTYKASDGAADSNVAAVALTVTAVASVPTEGDDRGATAIRGTPGNDTLNGLGGNDELFGLGGDDTLNGGIGNDILEGGLGRDRLDGGAGTDAASYVQATAGVIADLLTPAANTGEAAGDSFVSVEDLVGSRFDDVLSGSSAANAIQGGDGADRISGQGSDDRLTGGAGNDTIDGGSGADRMYGGAGDDTYAVENVGDQVSEANPDTGANEGGTDTVNSSVSFTLGAFVENLTLTGSAVNGTGNDLANVLTGNAAANILNGADGDDSLSGGAGNDSLVGGSGIDTLFGGAGNDTLDAGAGSTDRWQNLSGEIGNDTYRIGRSSGKVLIDARYEAASMGTDGVVFTDLGASDLSFSRYDNGAADPANGTSLQLDWIGGTLRVGLGGSTIEGYQFADGTRVSRISGATASGETITGSADSDLLLGLEGGETIDGAKGNDALFGRGGDDKLKGGVGNDILDGGAGSDTAVFSDKTVAVVATLNGTANATVTVGGIAEDTIRNIESLIGGSAADRFTGDGFGNTFTGGAGNDVFAFKGGFGRDIIADFKAGAGAGDVIDFDHSLFASFAAVKAAAKQVGSDTLITVDANTTLLLKAVAASGLHADDVLIT